jgi:glycosyltransferase involved in cell wall biosynthesis
MGKPRIILVNRVYWPSTAATAQLLTDLAEGLAARGWEVHVVAAGEASTCRNGVTIHRAAPTDRPGDLFSRSFSYSRFRRAARQRLPQLARRGDIVVAMTDPPLLGSALAKIVAAQGAVLVHWVQDIYPEIAAAHFGAWAGLALAPVRSQRDAAWRTARTCVTLGETMATTLLQSGVPRERVALIGNWAPRELEQPTDAATIAARRSAWGLQDKFIVAYSGNLGRVHEFAAVLAAARRLQARPDIAFVFTGAGARFNEVRSAALENIHLRPPEPREQLAAALAAADAQLVTLKPKFAGLVFPSKLAGVLASGRPVLFVGPRDGEIAQLLEREQCGVPFGPDEGDGLATQIELWAANRKSCRTAGRRARAVYERRFTFESALARWEEVLSAAARP